MGSGNTSGWVGIGGCGQLAEGSSVRETAEGGLLLGTEVGQVKWPCSDSVIEGTTEHDIKLAAENSIQLQTAPNKPVSISQFLDVQKKAAVPAPSSSDGRFWVKDQTPTVPMFTDSAGTHHELLAGLPSAAGLPGSYVTGLNITFLTATMVAITPGAARDSTNVADIVLASATTVDLAAAGANGLDFGTPVLEAWYFVFVIADKSGTMPSAGLLSSSHAAPTLPTGYDIFRRIGSIRNADYYGIMPFVMFGHRMRTLRYTCPMASRSVLNAGSATVQTPVSCTAFVPPTSRLAGLSCREQGSAFYGLYADPAAPTNYVLESGQGGTFASFAEFPTSSDQRIAYRHSSPGGSLDIWVSGFTEEM